MNLILTDIEWTRLARFVPKIYILCFHWFYLLYLLFISLLRVSLSDLIFIYILCIHWFYLLYLLIITLLRVSLSDLIFIKCRMFSFHTSQYDYTCLLEEIFTKMSKDKIHKQCSNIL